MAKTKKPKEAIIPSDDVIAQAVLEGQALISEGKTKVEAAMAITATSTSALRRSFYRPSLKALPLPQGGADLLVQLPQEVLAGSV